MRSIANRIAGTCAAAGLVIAGGLAPLPVLAANPLLDDAYAHLVKAAAKVNAAAYGGEPGNVVMHRQRAVRLIEQAEREIANAKQAADASTQGSPTIHTAPRVNPATTPRLR
jgi:hypothetical protein